MSLPAVVFIAWGVFWVFWLVLAVWSKQAAPRRRLRPPGVVLLVFIVMIRLFRTDTLAVHAAALKVIGVILLVAGLALCVWARLYLGRNWGMPMTEKLEPELVTSGPYRFVRHPIYSGLLLGVTGTALATNLYWLAALVVLGAFFVYSARVEESIMTRWFPAAYAAYRERTKMLIPFVL
jgi:protein-S-isoprenylcysteine O-methyltransferase Ste14